MPKFWMPFFPGKSLLLSTTVLNDRVFFVWNSYDLIFKSYGLLCANMLNEAKWLLTQR